MFNRRTESHDRNDGKANECELPIQGEQNDGDSDHLDDEKYPAQQSVADKHTYRIDIRSGARHQLAGLGTVVKGVTQLLQLVIKKPAQVRATPLREILGEIALPVIENAAGKPGGGDRHCEKRYCPHLSRTQGGIDGIAGQARDKQ